MNADQTREREGVPRRIIVVGGGKGGVGKSIMAANLATMLARTGRRTILVDMDFGSANLHTCIGEKSPSTSIKDLLLKKKSNLKDVVIDTNIEDLKFISGAGDMPGLANMKYFQKQKIIRHLRTLDSDFVVIDSSPGITFNVLDFFSVADTGILITTPESTSTTNTFSFLKAILFRKLTGAFKKNADVMFLLDMARDPRNEHGVHTIPELEAGIKRIDPAASAKFRSILEEFDPKFILNMVRREEDLESIHVLQALVEEYLSISFECLGSCSYDEVVPESVSKMTPFVLAHPGSDAARSLRGLVEKLTGEDIEYSVSDDVDKEEMSGEDLVENVVNLFEANTSGGRWARHVSSERPRVRNNE